MSATPPSPASFILSSPSGVALDGLLDLPDPGRFPGPRPAVVICHGSQGFLEWGFLPSLAALLAERGFVAVRFNIPAEVPAVLAAVREGAAPFSREKIDAARIGLFGHSHGGADALRAAAKTPGDVRALVTWAAIVPVSEGDFLAGRTAPWLLVHGEDDESVPVAEARRLAEASRSSPHPAELLLLPGANHTFGARHPFAGPNPRLIQALNATQRWLRRFL